MWTVPQLRRHVAEMLGKPVDVGMASPYPLVVSTASTSLKPIPPVEKKKPTTEEIQLMERGDDHCTITTERDATAKNIKKLNTGLVNIILILKGRKQCIIVLT